MFNQHAKWLKVCNEIEWRRPIASLNYLLSSHVWRQDHNGFSRQDPGFIDHVINKKAEVVRAICRRTPIISSRSPTIACGVATTSTSLSPASSSRSSG
jgi:D-xylulose 5-phosphate/D-fructose 6-phosphate phosphoketolase